MDRKEMEDLISTIHKLMECKEFWLIGFLLKDTKHGSKDYSLTLLRSSFSLRDKYQEEWNIQLGYAKEFWPETHESILKGLF